MSNKAMKAYLIDPFEKRVTEVEYSGKINDICRLIRADIFDCVVFNSNNDGVFVDDEGLYEKNNEFFRLGRSGQPLAGRGLVLGCDDEGESIEPSISLEGMRAMVSWLSQPVARLIISMRYGDVE